MQETKVKVTLHGALGEKMGKREWNLCVSSISEALHAINTLTDQKLNKTFYDFDRKRMKFGILINKKEFEIEDDRSQDNAVFLKMSNLESIDIVPEFEGSVFAFLASAAFFIFGATPTTTLMAITLLSYALSNSLSEPPTRPDQRQIINPNSAPATLANSYLFSGPVNVLNEGGPVPIGYGRLMVGSQVIQSSYDVYEILTRDAGRQR